ncbi:MAG: hypothetical protein IPJ65_02430 [Archangiaceae bacterium]|nr:hypothetical protein [Archangiaceae bacterium]
MQLAGDDRPWFLSAVDAPHGGDLLPIDAVTDGGNAPHLARLSAYDFTPLHVDLFDCPGTHVSEWENLVWHGESGRVFAVLRTSANPMNGNCTAVVPGAFFGGGAGTIQPGLHRLLFGLENDGDSALGGLVTFLGDEPADAGALALVADGHDSLWGAGTVLGSLQGVTVPVPTLSVFNLDTQHFGVLFRNWRAEGAGHAELDDLAVLPSQQIWVLGTVSGSMVPEDGGTAVVTSIDSDTDGFLMRLNPSTLAPVAKVVFGNPHVSERMVKMVVRPPYAYVLATATPRPGAEGPYVFGGFDLGSLDSRDVLVFRIKLP